ncbi:MAG: MFS transporter [Dehalococcoidia bacterium]
MAQTLALKQIGPIPLVATVAAGIILGPLNSTMLAVTLSPLAEDFGVSTGWAAWLIASYLIVMAAGQPITGRLGDLVGRRRLFIAGLVYFGAASALAMVSWNFPSLVFFRVQQAVGGALFMPNGIAALRSSLPQEMRGRAFGSLGAIIAVSAGVGPPLGGVLVDTIGWRALFAVNLPLVVAAIALALRYFPHIPGDRSRQAFDILGMIVLSAGLFALIVATTTLGRKSPSDPVFVTTALLALALGALFIWWEGRHPSPIISLGMFRRRTYAAGTATIFLSNLGMYTVLIVAPLFLQDLRGNSASRAGLMLLAISLFVVLLAPISGLVADRVGRNVPAVAGALLLTLGAVAVATWDGASSMAYIAMSLGLFGIGLGVIQAPVQTAAIEACPASMAGAASGTYSTARYLGAIVGTGLVGAFLSDGELTEVSVFRQLMLVLAVIVALTVVSTLNIHRWAEAPGPTREEMGDSAS